MSLKSNMVAQQIILSNPLLKHY